MVTCRYFRTAPGIVSGHWDFLCSSDFTQWCEMESLWNIRQFVEWFPLTVRFLTRILHPILGWYYFSDFWQGKQSRFLSMCLWPERTDLWAKQDDLEPRALHVEKCQYLETNTTYFWDCSSSNSCKLYISNRLAFTI